MYSFKNDYSECSHPEILNALKRINLEQNLGYGMDVHSLKAKEYLMKHLHNEDVDIHFLSGGTQTNLTAISSFLRSYQCVIAAENAHINTHETGAIEATGHKILTVPSVDGKITPESIEEILGEHTNEHTVQPKLVYISNSTELGTIYSKMELESIAQVCRANGLILYLDGARLGSALVSDKNDLSLADIVALVDAFYIGGTKNGALLGEALVICNDTLKENFRYCIKQRGAMLAKGFIVGVQFETLFENDLFFELAIHANKMAKRLAKSIENSGFKLYTPVETNQLFIVLPNPLLPKLSEKFAYEVQKKLGENTVIRFVTSWATTEESVDKLGEFLNEYSNNK